MGFFKRFSERMKQTAGIKGTGGDWKPTSNARNVAMLEEAQKFSKELKKMHRELRNVQETIEGGFNTMKNVLNAPLPRTFEITDTGAVPVDKEMTTVGLGVRYDVLAAAAADLKAKLQQEVLQPLNQWHSAYKTIKARNEKVEELRLELDAKRRDAAYMQINLEKQKTKASSAAAAKAAADAVNGGDTEHKFEDAEFKLQKEEDKVTRLTQRYKDIELEVFQALVTLITDTKVLKQYAATALVVYQNAFTHAYAAFAESDTPPQLAPMPVPTSSPSKLPGSGGSTAPPTPPTPLRPAPLALAVDAQAGAAGPGQPPPPAPVLVGGGAGGQEGEDGQTSPGTPVYPTISAAPAEPVAAEQPQPAAQPAPPPALALPEQHPVVNLEQRQGSAEAETPGRLPQAPGRQASELHELSTNLDFQSAQGSPSARSESGGQATPAYPTPASPAGEAPPPPPPNQTPAWYSEAKQNAKSMNYDSDG